MIDLDFDDVACWISEPIADPVAFENWVGNRLYNIIPLSDNKEWETALLKAKLSKVGATIEETLKETVDMSVILDAVQPRGVIKIGDLGTVVAIVGKPEKIEANKIKIPADEILIIKVPKGEKIKLDIRHKFKVEVDGGEAGIIIDTRGRPFAPPTADFCGRERLKKWQKAWQLS